MTTRRRFRSRGGRRRRSARLVWVNAVVDTTVTLATTQITNLLTVAETFMLFDTTIVNIRLAQLSYQASGADAVGLSEAYAALVTGDNDLDADDVQDISVSHIGESWLYLAGQAQRHGTAQFDVPLVEPINGGVQLRANRRFRENDQTLWLVRRYNDTAVPTDLTIHAVIRVLLRIP